MSDDLIRRSDAIDAIMETCCYCSETKVLTEIRNLPTIEPKRGEWIPVKASIHPYGNDVKCSVCGHRMGSSFGYNFCPNCGARMKGADDE